MLQLHMFTLHTIIWAGNYKVIPVAKQNDDDLCKKISQ